MVTLTGVATWSASILQLQNFLATHSGFTPYQAVSTSLAADIGASASSVQVSSAGGFPASDTFIAALSDTVHTEYLLVTGGMGTTSWTVIRSYNGSTSLAFAAANTKVTWLPLATERSDAINGSPLSSIAATFAQSVGGASGGTLTAPVPNGQYTFSFSDGESRAVTVQAGTAVSWTPALAAGSVFTAATQVTVAPAGTLSSSPEQILAQRFDIAAPVYITQRQRLSRRGALLVADFPVSGAITMQVDDTSDFQQTGNFLISTGFEDVLVNVADATTLNIVARAQDGTVATALLGAATEFYQISEVDFQGGGGTQAYFVPGALNSGRHYLGVAPTIGALREYNPEMPLSMHFVFDGSSFELLASGNVSLFVIADGQIQHSANALVDSPYSGRYWHKFDFGSRKPRHITLFAEAYPMAMAYAATDNLSPWDRSADPVLSFDADSFGGTEGNTWQSTPNGGGLGLYFEAMLALGLSQYDFAAAIGGTGYSQEGLANLPTYPRSKFSGIHRLATLVAGPAPSIFLCGLGHNDNSIARAQFSADTTAYWTALRAAWPNTVFVAAQYFFPAAGAAAPLAFQPNPLSTPNDPAILAALTAVGGPWVFINSNSSSWQNSSGAAGVIGTPGQPLLTGTGFGGAPGYRGGHGTSVGNGDVMIRDDGIHPSNLGSQYLGNLTAAAIAAGVLAL